MCIFIYFHLCSSRAENGSNFHHAPVKFEAVKKMRSVILGDPREEGRRPTATPTTPPTPDRPTPNDLMQGCNHNARTIMQTQRFCGLPQGCDRRDM